jgi:DNA-binding PadR family transcriptional regulator
MQDNILLGFLMYRPMTGYEVKKAMGGSTEFFFNTSLGSIYPAFGRLEKQSLVKKERRVERGRAKNVYHITPKGKRHFLSWLEKAPKLANIREESLLKMFFYEHADAPTRGRQVREYIGAVDERLKELLSLRNRLEGGKASRYQMNTLDFGIEFYRFQRRWYERFLDSLENETN